MRRTSFFTSLFFGLVLFCGCKRTSGTEEFIGPKDTTTPLGFSVVGNRISPSVNLISFSSGDLFFLAQFSDPVSWNIRIQGNSSGAIRTLTGVSDRVDSTNSRFDGRADSLFFFRPGETCTATLSITGWKDRYTTSFAINQLKPFDCLLIDDFENASDSVGFCVLYEDEGDSLLEYRGGNQLEILEGRQSLKLSGFDSNENYWLSTLTTKGMDFSTLLDGKEAPATFLNFFAKGQAEGHTEVQIRLDVDENNDGVFDSTTDSRFYRSATLTGHWSQFRWNLASFVNTGPNGAAQVAPSRILDVTLILVANPAGGYTEAYLDFISFTFGKPFSQR